MFRPRSSSRTPARAATKRRALLFTLLLLTSFGLAQTSSPAEAPPRNSQYVALGGFLSTGGAPVARLLVGDDAAFGEPAVLGVRASLDVGFTGTAPSLAGAATWRHTAGRVDGYAALGTGLRFVSPPLPFGEMVMGASYRVDDHWGPFAEGRYRFYAPHGAATQASAGSLAVGVQLRPPF